MENPSELLGPKGLIRKDEFVRIIAQSLYSLGYNNSASQLELESGVSYKCQEFKLLETHVVNGDWENCTTVLNSIKDVLGKPMDSALFLVLRQHFVEHVSRGEVAPALDLLRKQISVLHVDKCKVHSLANTLITLKNDELGAIDGCDVHALRRRLLKELENLLPPPISFSERRLEYLVETAVVSSMSRCIYHNSSDSVTLYMDHLCIRDQIPTTIIQTLTEHEHEVWFVQFSNNGDFLASVSNEYIIIWKVDEHWSLSSAATLDNDFIVDFVAWSPDDTKLLAYGIDGLKLWDVGTGTCKLTIGTEEYGISCCAWYPNSTQFVWGSFDIQEGIFMLDSDAKMNQVQQVRLLPEVDGVAFTPDGKHYICTSTQDEILIHRIGGDADRVVSEEHAITSLSVSADSMFFIVSLCNNEIHMWDVAGRWNTPMIFLGHKQDDTVLMSCFGGWKSRFIASGSDDSKVYIWNRSYPSNPIKILSGHAKAVNCVSWNPKRPQMLASASDDCTVLIWGPNS